VPPSTPKACSTPERFGRHIVRLEQLYASMDRSYKNAADHYGFACNGCEDNCCLTLFHHHTHIEFFYLNKGFRALDRQRQVAIAEKAQTVCSAVRWVEKNGPPLQQMCPLNVDNRCSLYAFRPMICRLHGIPSELHRPDGKTTRAPGCASFTDRCGQLTYVQFDRTPLYRDLAGIERALKRDMPDAGKIKMTVAEMILAFECET
jgi:Fe-S-cluster containining protein